ncbi:hypothetical protein ZA09C12_38140 [Escherichia coli]
MAESTLRSRIVLDTYLKELKNELPDKGHNSSLPVIIIPDNMQDNIILFPAGE